MLPRASMKKECTPKEEELLDAHTDSSLGVPLSNPARPRRKHNSRGNADTTVVSLPDREWEHTVTEIPFMPWWYGLHGTRLYAVFVGRHRNYESLNSTVLSFCILDPISLKIQETCTLSVVDANDLPLDFAVVEVPKIGIVCFSMSKTRTVLKWRGKSISSSRLECTNEKGWEYFSASKDRVILTEAGKMLKIYNINTDGKTLSLEERNRLYVYAPTPIDDVHLRHSPLIFSMAIDDTNRVILNYSDSFFTFGASLDTYISPRITKTYEGAKYSLITVCDNILFGVRAPDYSKAIDSSNYPLIVDAYKITRETIEHIREHRTTINGEPQTFSTIGTRSLVVGTSNKMYTFHL